MQFQDLGLNPGSAITSRKSLGKFLIASLSLSFPTQVGIIKSIERGLEKT